MTVVDCVKAHCRYYSNHLRDIADAGGPSGWKLMEVDLFSGTVEGVELTRRKPEGECTMQIGEAEKNFANLVNKVYLEGISVDLERDDKIIACLTPAEPRSPVTVGELNALLRNLPSLGNDADDFAHDVRAIRAEFPAEINQ